jgi:hypothetical protein
MLNRRGRLRRIRRTDDSGGAGIRTPDAADMSRVL